MPSTSHSEIDARYRYACEIARAAASRAYSWYQQRQNLVVEHKRDLQDVVSDADRNVEALIKTLIAERFPDDAVYGEDSDGEIGNATFIWAVDPINGTACFVNGLPNWCVSLAVVCDGQPVIGVVCDPTHQELFHARQGQGAWVNETRLQVHAAQHLNEGLLGISNSSRTGGESVTRLISGLIQQGGMFIRIGSGALTSAWAAGRLIGYYEAHMHPWDSLPGIVLMREAGGVTKDYLGNDGLKNGNPVLLANTALYPQIKALTGNRAQMIK